MTENASYRNLFPKSERLFLTKDIDHLFAKGKAFSAYPLQIIYYIKKGKMPFENGISILASVPKKRIKKAARRNKIKRLIRENYRLNKHSLAKHIQGYKLHIAFVYISNETPSYSSIDKALNKALSIIKERI